MEESGLLARDRDAAVSFSKFGEFPLEIRRFIWKAALPGPRIVHLDQYYPCEKICYSVRSDIPVERMNHFKSNEALDCEEDCENHEPFTGFRSRCHPPAILQVCHESFEVASQFYERAFGRLGARPMIWFNFDIDYLYADWGRLDYTMLYYPDDIGLGELQRVKHLAMYQEERDMAIRGCRSLESWIAFVLNHFCNLESITVSRGLPAHTPHETSHLVFKDPIPIQVTACYDLVEKGWTQDDIDLNYLRRGLRGHVVEMRHWIDIEKLEEYLWSWVDEDGAKKRLPFIDTKIITTPERKTRLERAEENARKFLEAKKTSSVSIALDLPE
ncbi:hypothetical protein BGZ60DRAFT_405907 [Tricladium varicosporioides]|nr:hypothetical protein BGZ60DRAFT_405907 [Hymenoscyphus varicosporioides]